jgi:hypothetical protein
MTEPESSPRTDEQQADKNHGRMAYLIRFSFRRGLPPASLLNFLSGILAGAGISLFTAAEISQTRLPFHDIVLDSAAWVAAAVFTSSAAYVAEGASRKADLLIASSDPAKLKQDIRRDNAALSAPRFCGLILFALICVGLAAYWAT